MKITAVTATHNRPEAFALCERHVSKQKLQPFQWIVLDDGKYPAVPTMGQDYIYEPSWAGRSSLPNKMAAIVSRNLVRGDMVIFVEDDDYYAPDWFEVCHRGVQSVQLFGEGRALYYNVRSRWWQRHDNMVHASLCSTACHRSALPALLTVSETCQQIGSPWLDTHFWSERSLTRHMIDPMTTANGFRHRVVGIKGMPGAEGYSMQHRQKVFHTVDDPDLQNLTQFIGAEEAKLYAEFHDPTWGTVDAPPPPPTSQVTRSMFAQIHGRQWWDWLDRYRGRKDLHGLEIGHYGSDVPEWVLDNVLTHPSTTFMVSGQGDAGPARERLARFGHRALFMDGSSTELAPSYPERFDVIFVGRHHEVRAMLEDILNAFSMLKPGGMMIFTEYKWAGDPNANQRPRTAIDTFLSGRAHQLRVMDPMGEHVAVIKK
jgi:hypothetical protein